ncbi:MAG: acylphosphatase [Burkholderiales bacterium]
MADIARRLVVRGRVQGVGYRHAAVEAARGIGVAGWVRNRPDGTVEALAQGTAADVERFVAWCRRGPPLARVDDVEVGEAWVDAGLARFDWKAGSEP